MTTGVLIFISAIGLFSSFVSGIFGMAGGQILLASLLLFMPVASSLVVFAAVQVVSGGWRGWLWRKHVDWTLTWKYIAGSLAAYACMRFVNFVPSKPMVYLGIGLMPFAAFALPKSLAPDVTRPGAAYLCGAFVMALPRMLKLAFLDTRLRRERGRSEAVRRLRVAQPREIKLLRAPGAPAHPMMSFPKALPPSSPPYAGEASERGPERRG